MAYEHENVICHAPPPPQKFCISNLYRHQNEVPFRFQEYSNKQEELSKPFKFPISSSEADPLQAVTCNTQIAT